MSQLLDQLTEDLVAYPGLDEHSGHIYEVGHGLADTFDPSRHWSFSDYVLTIWKLRRIDEYRRRTSRGKLSERHELVEDDLAWRDKDWSIPELPEFLDERERKVCVMLAQGATQKDICLRLGMPKSSMSRLVASIGKRLGEYWNLRQIEKKMGEQ